MSTRKRPASIIPGGATLGAVKRVKKEPSADTSNSTDDASLRTRFIQLLEEFSDGITTPQIKERFGEDALEKLGSIINELIKESRLNVKHKGEDLHFEIVSEDVAKRFHGLDGQAKMVYQAVERAGNKGIWTKDIKNATGIHQQALNKIFKQLESRHLIKPIKSVNAKAKKLYMLYNLTPSTELTGGVWYSNSEFDHEFINEIRQVLIQLISKINAGRGVTLEELLRTVQEAKITRVEIKGDELTQVLQNLVYDYLIDQVKEADGTTKYTPARKVSTRCDFSLWRDVLEDDFMFRRICYEDGVVLEPQEPHYHTESCPTGIR